ncbi:MAG TPA: siderophore-interacting protein [Steroidobacteraceae bacterium]|nr:siderophore-interacting protein [Steroidobacteraceae bacterium]
MTDRPEVRRVRHETRLRRLQVCHVQHLTPRMLRVGVAGGELAGFTSLGFDDHVKVFVPPSGTGELALPTLGPDGPIYPEGAPRPAMRDYTPRKYDAAAGILYIDFVIHEAGPATTWAARARPGQVLGVGGPRGSFVIPTQFDWHLLIGDETALPAIGRRLEELPADTRALVVAEVDDPSEELQFQSAAPFEVVWVHRSRNGSNTAQAGDPRLLLQKLRTLGFPSGEYFAWIAAEVQVARALRQYLLSERSAKKEWVKAAGYWRRGAIGAHERIED